MSIKEISNGKSHWDKDNISTNESDSFKRENKLPLNNESQKTDCFEVANNSYSKDHSIGDVSMYKNDNKNLQFHKNIEPIENQWEISGNEKL